MGSGRIIEACRRFLCVVIAACASGGCPSDQVSVSWQIRFARDDMRARAVAVEATLRDGGCASTAVIYSEEILRGDTAPSPPRVRRGIYGFEARARDGACQWFAKVCQGVELDDDGTVVTLVLADATPEAACPTAECDAGTCGTPPDSGPGDGDADVDADADQDVDADAETGPFDCVESLVRACQPDVADPCYDGQQACRSGAWTPCEPVDGTALEVCDGRDNDCDLDVDEDLDCPFDSVWWNDEHAYFFSVTPDTWLGARDTCRSLGFDLVVIDDLLENGLVADEAWRLATEYCWIGLNDLDVEGTYRWSRTGELAAFTGWAPGEPDAAYEDEDCGTTNYALVGGWNDYPCDAPLPFVCEAY